MRTPSPYVPDPARANVRLSVDEVEAVIRTNGKGFVRNSDAVMHFVRRVQLTMRMLIERDNHLQGVIHEQQKRQIVGAATTLNPMDAVRFVSRDQLEGLFTGLKRDTLERIHRQETLLADERVRCVSLAAQAQLVMEAAANELSPATRERLGQMIADLLAAGSPTTPTPEVSPAPPAPAFGPLNSAPTPAPADTPHPDFDDLWDEPDHEEDNT